MENKNSNQIEAFALEPVSAENRKSWISVTFVQAGMFICVPSLLLGAMLAQSMLFWHAAIAGILGYLLTLVLTFVLGMQGADLGIPTCAICQSTFGRKGVRLIVSSLFGISLMGWFGLQTSVCGEAFTNIIREGFGFTIPVSVSSVIWGLIMLATAVFGMNALNKLDSLSVPLMVFIMVLGTVLALRSYGTAGLGTEVEESMSIMQGIGLSFSFSAVGAITAADITRFQRNRKDTIKSSFWGIMPAGLFTLVLGILMTKITGVYDISMVLVAVGIPFLGIIILVLATWTTNSLNAYCGGLNVIMTFNLPDNRRREATFAAGIVGILLSVLGILGHIEQFLSLLSYVFSAIGGVMIADYWFVGKGKKENWHPQEGYNWTGIIATILGVTGAALIGIEYSGILFALVIFLIIERFVPSQSRNKNTQAVNEEKTGGTINENII